ncbi:hypothetical protein HV144_13100 [Citrobacter freundii]|nr:hypothetical protein [Citrobacter freundii]
MGRTKFQADEYWATIGKNLCSSEERQGINGATGNKLEAYLQNSLADYDNGESQWPQLMAKNKAGIIRALKSPLTQKKQLPKLET